MGGPPHWSYPRVHHARAQLSTRKIFDSCPESWLDLACCVKKKRRFSVFAKSLEIVRNRWKSLEIVRKSLENRCVCSSMKRGVRAETPETKHTIGNVTAWTFCLWCPHLAEFTPSHTTGAANSSWFVRFREMQEFSNDLCLPQVFTEINFSKNTAIRSKPHLPGSVLEIPLYMLVFAEFNIIIFPERASSNNFQSPKDKISGDFQRFLTIF